jgi:hypothetical protein
VIGYSFYLLFIPPPPTQAGVGLKSGEAYPERPNSYTEGKSGDRFSGMFFCMKEKGFEGLSASFVPAFHSTITA